MYTSSMTFFIFYFLFYKQATIIKDQNGKESTIGDPNHKSKK